MQQTHNQNESHGMDINNKNQTLQNRQNDLSESSQKNEEKKTAHKHMAAGKLTSSEVEKLKKAIEKELERTGFTLNDLSAHFAREKKLQGFSFKDVAAALPDRKYISVFHWITRNFFFTKNAGRWSPEEENALREMRLRGTTWKEIARTLRRLPIDCRDKWRLIQRDYNKGAWSLEEDKKLLRLVNNFSVNGMPPKADVLWTVVSEKMKTRSHSQCRLRYYNQLYKIVTDPNAWLFEDDLELIRNIYASGAEAISEVQWRTISKRWPSGQAKERWLQLAQRVPQNEKRSFDDIVQFLYDDFNATQLDDTIDLNSLEIQAEVADDEDIEAAENELVNDMINAHQFDNSTNTAETKIPPKRKMNMSELSKQSKRKKEK